MTVHKLSISVPAEIAELIKDSAAREGASVSAWMTHAAKAQAAQQVDHDEGLIAARELVAESQALHGPISEEARRWGDEVLAALGLRREHDELPAAA